MVYPATFEQKIGFDEIRTLLKGYCMSTLGKDEVDALKFSTQAKEINELLTHIREFRRILEESDDFPLQYFFDVREAVSRLRLEGTHLEENELFDLSFLDILDLLVLRGDKSKQDSRFIPKEGGLRYASELCQQINDFNNGKLVYGGQHELPHQFSYGVAGYPEKHEEAMNMTVDIQALKKKVELGAGYIVTQMFFDNQKYFDFVKRCREVGINVPIVPGLKPLSTINHLTMLPRTFHIDFPEKLSQKLAKCQNNDDVKEVGIEWCIEQCRELREHDVPSLHFYTMNAAAQIETIMNNL